MKSYKGFSHITRFRFTALSGLLFALLLSGAVAGCSAAGEPGAIGETEISTPDEEGVRLITRPNSVYTIDDLATVGFKKNKKFALDTLPGAIDAWYGFFQQKDIEVRFYETHDAALEMGVELAEVIIARTAGQRDPLIPVVNLYPAYAVVGNTIMLCERQLATCEALIEALK